MMYLPENFAQPDDAKLYGLIRANPLGVLIVVGPDGLMANHIPFVLETRQDGSSVLIGHVARNNSVWSTEIVGEALVIFQDADAYISPTFYPTKAETHEVVPTWTYAVVHAHGPLLVHDDPRWVRGAVGKLTKQMEAAESPPWKMADAPSEYLMGMIENIVGIEIPVGRLVGKWKVSQNRHEADRDGARAGLERRGTERDRAMAALIREG